MRVLIAPDCFGSTLTAAEAAAAIAAGWASVAPHDVLDPLPLSDGGPGFLDVLAAGVPAATVTEVAATGPLGDPVVAQVLLAGDRAYVETAQVCGLHLIEARDPTVTTSYGVGALLRAAAATGASEVVFGLGGSATNDGGAGAWAALGAEPGELLAGGGAALAGLREVSRPDWPTAVSMVLATDVAAPLLGHHGASEVFGPQKGATAEQVAALDAALTVWADVVEAAVGRRCRDTDGAGAAGGLGFGLLALGSRRVPGVSVVADVLRLAERVSAADLVVTGEGRYDAQSLRGKVCGGVAHAAAAAGVPVVVLAGQAAVGRREYAAAGVEEVHSVAEVLGSPAAALAAGAGGVSELAGRVARLWSRGRQPT